MIEGLLEFISTCSVCQVISCVLLLILGLMIVNVAIRCKKVKKIKTRMDSTVHSIHEHYWQTTYQESPSVRA